MPTGKTSNVLPRAEIGQADCTASAVGLTSYHRLLVANHLRGFIERAYIQFGTMGIGDIMCHGVLQQCLELLRRDVVFLKSREFRQVYS